MLRQNSQGRSSETWEQKGVAWLKGSMGWRKHSIRLKRRPVGQWQGDGF